MSIVAVIQHYTGEFLSLIDYIKGLDAVWFLSDEFGFKSFSQHYFNRNHKVFAGYVHDKFELHGYFNCKANSNDPSTIGRFRNLLTGAIKSNVYLPKLIVSVPDDDLIKFVDSKSRNGHCDNYALEKVINWLMREQYKIIETYKTYLPDKVKQPNFPQLIWIEAPYHRHFINNERRMDFNKCLRSLAKLHINVSVLQLKKVWDPEDKIIH